MKCPNCDYERRPTDEAPAWQCPACKVAYVKAARGRSSEGTLPVVAANPVRLQAPHDTSKEHPASKEHAVESESDEELLHLLANGQRILIRALLLTFALHALQRSGVFPSWAVDFLFIGVAIYSLMGILKICSGLRYHHNRKILCLVLAFLPLFNLILLVILGLMATEKLRAAGWNVGLFGVKP